MKRALVLVLGPLLILIIVFAILASRQSPELDQRYAQDALKRKRRAYVDMLQHELGSVSAVSLRGADEDILQINSDDCNSATMHKMFDIPDVRDALQPLHFSSMRCGPNGDEYVIPWGGR